MARPTKKQQEMLDRPDYKSDMREYEITTIKRFTCFNCDSSPTCEFAYDLYNTDGDCLALK